MEANNNLLNNGEKEADKYVSEDKMAEALRNDVYKDDESKKDLSDKEIIESYINDNETKVNAIYWATQFEERFNGNWFTIEKVRKKTTFKTLQQALGIMQVLCLVGVAHSTNDNGVVKYKITLDLEQKILLLNKEVERSEIEKQNAINHLTMQYDLKIAALKGRIADMSSISGEVDVEIVEAEAA